MDGQIVLIYIELAREDKTAPLPYLGTDAYCTNTEKGGTDAYCTNTEKGGKSHVRLRCAGPFLASYHAETYIYILYIGHWYRYHALPCAGAEKGHDPSQISLYIFYI